MTRQADRNAERQDPKGLGPEGMRAAVCEADAPTTSPMDKTVEVSQAARDFLDAAYTHCGMMEARALWRELGPSAFEEAALHAIAAALATRATQPEAALREALEQAIADHLWSDDRISFHCKKGDLVAVIKDACRATLSPAEPSPESREVIIEECALIADARRAEERAAGNFARGHLAEDIASAIRALSAPAHD